MTGTLAGPLTETRLRAMGTDVHLAIVGGDDGVLQAGVERIRALEARWSRFLDTSEITALNRRAGHPVIVSADTFALVSYAVYAWEATAGRFDPTVGGALAAHGYDRDFGELAATTRDAPRTTCPTPGAAGIDLIADVHAVTLPAHAAFDPGGIGKGFAADLTAVLLLCAGAEGALVDVGGDLRVAGRPPTPEGWVISIPDPLRPEDELLRVALTEGAVATSSRLLRRWQTTAGEAHHLIDPATGRPAETDTVAVTVIAGEAWWAEVLTKSLFLSGPDGLRDHEGIHALVVSADGTRQATPGLEAMVR
jgi:thiamine biosynthesis lipoprotein